MKKDKLLILFKDTKKLNKTIGDNSDDEKPPFEATTLWDYPKQSYGKTPKGNNKFNGVTPAFIIWNLVQRYTAPGDTVIDLMVGSGTTIDVCKEENRKVFGSDLVQFRPDIIPADARKAPFKNNSADMIFIDSPYSNNVKYSDDPRCIGKISCEEERFFNELEKVIKEAHRILKPGKVLGWLIGDQWIKNTFTPVGFKLFNQLLKYFEPVDVICVVRRNQSSNTKLWQYRARKFNFFLRGFKYLFIVRKPDNSACPKKKHFKKEWARYQPGKTNIDVVKSEKEQQK